MYQGEQGGLYPGGLNMPPAAHWDAGLALARKIVSLDAEGKPSATGKLVLLSIGMSNTTAEFSAFQLLAAREDRLNPKLRVDLVATLHNLQGRFPNLKIAYLSSRIYGGYAATPLNPEPHAYEGAFAVKWIIEDQIAGDAELNYDPAKGPVRSPWIAWGPYLWADGAKGRKQDSLAYLREDFGPDGTHPSESGRRKVTQQLLDFFKTDTTCRTWFLAN